MHAQSGRSADAGSRYSEARSPHYQCVFKTFVAPASAAWPPWNAHLYRNRLL